MFISLRAYIIIALYSYLSIYARIFTYLVSLFAGTSPPIVYIFIPLYYYIYI